MIYIPKKATNEEMMNDALKHYEEASNAINHWNSEIPKAIKAYYAPPLTEVTDELPHKELYHAIDDWYRDEDNRDIDSLIDDINVVYKDRQHLPSKRDDTCPVCNGQGSPESCSNCGGTSKVSLPSKGEDFYKNHHGIGIDKPPQKPDELVELFKDIISFLEYRVRYKELTNEGEITYINKKAMEYSQALKEKGDK